jgi:tyrosinase
MSRDLSYPIALRYNNASAVKYLMSTPDIRAFQGNMSGADINAGVHGGGHYILGGSGLDFFASPNDPAFWLHHSMIDKVWSDWQALDPSARTWVLNGTDTIFDPPGATEMTLDFVQNWGYLSGTRKTAELLRVGYEGFCYKYT